MIDAMKLLALSRRASACTASLDAVMGTRPGVLDGGAVPPPPRHVEARNLDLIAASLAGGIIARWERSVSPAEAVDIWQRVKAEEAVDIWQRVSPEEAVDIWERVRAELRRRQSEPASPTQGDVT